MNKEEAISLFLNKSLEDVNLDMNDSYIDINSGIRYQIYTREEAEEAVKEIILSNLHRYPANYLIQFMNIPNYSYDNYFSGDLEKGITKILNNSSIEPKDKNKLIISLFNNFEEFFSHDIQKNNGFGGYFKSINNEEFFIENYLIYLFKD